MQWTEKYRPQTLKEVVGNDSAVKLLREWAEGWQAGKPEKNAVILVGAPGVGKTTCAYALANDYGWCAIELNASDTRNYEAIKRIAGIGASYETFTSQGEFISTKGGWRKLIILDEADNLFGKEDRGGMQAIVEVVRAARQPIVLIVNDYYELTRKSSAIKDLCLTIKFRAIQKDTIKSVLSRICKKEKIEIASEALTELAERANGDVRSAINDMQSVAEGRTKISLEDIDALGRRDPKETIFSALTRIFKTTSLEKARATLQELEEPPDYIILWLDENLPLEYKEFLDLKGGYEMLSRADVFLGRIIKRQYYGLWAYANDLTASIALAKQAPYRMFAKYQFPSWLYKMSRARTSRELEDNALAKLGKLCHISKAAARENILGWFKHLFKNQFEFAANMIVKLGLDSEETAWLLDEKPDSSKVKRLIESIEKKRAIKKEVTIKEYT
ncbi:MAG: replication factor C large subunit [Candidatus Thermoplasmatota archaeon]|nr:replication factor C large subunit [Candidatus Thermoplasmatota archaeon]